MYTSSYHSGGSGDLNVCTCYWTSKCYIATSLTTNSMLNPDKNKLKQINDWNMTWPGCGTRRLQAHYRTLLPCTAD